MKHFCFWKTTVHKFIAIAMAGTLLSACSSSAATIPQKAIQPTPVGQSGSLLSLGESFYEQGNPNGAIPLLHASLSSPDNRSRAEYLLGKSYMAIGEYQNAIEHLTKAATKNPNQPDVYLALGQVYLILKIHDLSQTSFQTAKDLAVNGSPEKARAYSGLGINAALKGNNVEATNIFNEGMAHHQNNLELKGNRGLFFAVSGQPEFAIDELTHIVLMPDATRQHRQNLALAYAFAGNAEKAWQIASIDLDPQQAREALAYYQTLRGLAENDRMQMLIYGQAHPRTDREETANLMEASYNGTGAAQRLLAKPEPEPIPKPEPVVEIPGLPPLMEAHGWAVQIAAYRTAEEIIRGWEILSTKYADIIGNLEPRRSEVEFGERVENGRRGFYYRLYAGPLAGFSESKMVCDALIAAGGDCWIRPPEPTEGSLPPKPITVTEGESNATEDAEENAEEEAAEKVEE